MSPSLVILAISVSLVLAGPAGTPCTSSNDCDSGTVCNAQPGTIPPNNAYCTTSGCAWPCCDSAKNCYTEEICTGGQCGYPPCNVTADCATDHHCESGSCMLGECHVDADCTGTHKCRTYDSTCICGVKADCPAGKWCSGASWTSDGCESGCGSDSDCGVDQFCGDFGCEDYGTSVEGDLCEVDTDCIQSLYCQGTVYAVYCNCYSNSGYPNNNTVISAECYEDANCIMQACHDVNPDHCPSPGQGGNFGYSAQASTDGHCTTDGCVPPSCCEGDYNCDADNGETCQSGVCSSGVVESSSSSPTATEASTSAGGVGGETMPAESTAMDTTELASASASASSTASASASETTMASVATSTATKPTTSSSTGLTGHPSASDETGSGINSAITVSSSAALLAIALMLL